MATEMIRQFARRDTAANWTSANPTLAAGEIGLETDTGKWKVGDGSTAWNSLAYSGQRFAADVMALLDDANLAAMRATLGLGSTIAVGGAHLLRVMASGDYADLRVNGSALTTVATIADRLDFFPLLPGRTVAIDEIATEVSTGAGSANCRIGIYSDVAGEPGTLLVGGVTNHDASSAAIKNEAVSLTLVGGGAYWAAVHGSGSFTYRGLAAASVYTFAVGNGTNAGPLTIKRASATYASGLPSTAPAATDTASGIPPYFRLRAA